MASISFSPPVFDFGADGVPAALARGLFVAALFSSYGTLLYKVRVAPAALKKLSARQAADLTRRYRQLVTASLIATLGLGLLWLVLQARALFDSHDLAAVAMAAAAATSTSFGRLLLLQLICSLAALLCFRLDGRNPILGDFAMGGIGLAVVLQAGHDHAAAMYDGLSLLMLSEMAHLLAGAAWLGSLVPLLITIRDAPASIGLAAARRYSKYATSCIIVLVITALLQGCQLIGSVAGLIGTGYGWVAIGKIALFAVLLALAANNRWRLTPALTGTSGYYHQKPAASQYRAGNLPWPRYPDRRQPAGEPGHQRSMSNRYFNRTRLKLMAPWLQLKPGNTQRYLADIGRMFLCGQADCIAG